jgi:hypothetical protein
MFVGIYKISFRSNPINQTLSSAMGRGYPLLQAQDWPVFTGDTEDETIDNLADKLLDKGYEEE